MFAGAEPIPKEERDGKSGVGVGPGGIEIHVDGQRTAPPDGQSGQESPGGMDEVASEAEGEQEGEEAVDAGS